MPSCDTLWTWSCSHAEVPSGLCQTLVQHSPPPISWGLVLPAFFKWRYCRNHVQNGLKMGRIFKTLFSAKILTRYSYNLTLNCNCTCYRITARQGLNASKATDAVIGWQPGHFLWCHFLRKRRDWLCSTASACPLLTCLTSRLFKYDHSYPAMTTTP